MAELVASQEECGTPVLSFSLPKELPEANLNIELQIRFTEILGGQTGKTISKSYAAAEIAGKTNIENFELKHLPPDMKDFGQYQVQVMLVMNGTKSVNWSPTSHTLCKCCKIPSLPPPPPLPPWSTIYNALQVFT